MKNPDTWPQIIMGCLIVLACMVTCSPAEAFQVCWEPPTENVDGTPLTDLAGYSIYFGTSPGMYPNSRTLSVAQAEAGDNCLNIRTAVGEYYVVATAFDTDGNESAHSNMVRKTETRLGGPSGGELLGPSGGGLIREEN